MDKLFTTEQLIDYCKSFKWTRQVKQLHVHHTWSPSHKDYNGSNGLELQQAMRNYHVNTLGWSDIGQHLTLLPDGQWVTGRDFNKDPASIFGWNEGAFAIEMLGNFDKGNDEFKDPQAVAMFKFCAAFCLQKILNVDTNVKFHRDSPTAGKTCPGTGIDRTWFMNKLKEAINVPETVEEWKLEGLKYLHDNGLLQDYDGWLAKLNDPIPSWAAFLIFERIHKSMKI